ncbi:DUF2939 domain-containing protein [methane-oxidizing endosymbiont of Gigantopelta aegis]|uniref:DUF2939 domain-containing protein n=1 Tax=methane-oxidizing endosymbiont of Gigantopelta aegis TaxID=2794938 RepID=UPI0018DDEB30|nr:DUF2939 domain-containing protein [methane-oxidizing endosymbiont of Gigantopelta aegis]
MQIKGIYVFLLLGFIQLAALFVASPYMTAQKIAEIIHTEDEAAWAKEIDQDYFKKYTRALLDGMLRIKMSADIQRGHTREALQDYTFASKTLEKHVNKLVSNQGIPRFLCGEVLEDVAKNDQTGGCWQAKGSVKWLGLNRAAIEYINPKRNWHSRLLLQRTGLLSWRVVDVELPLDQILQTFVNTLKAAEKM